MAFISIISNKSKYLQSLDLSQDKSIAFLKNTSEINLCKNNKNILITCITGEIIPKEIIMQFDLAFNVHPGHHLYPGRDPHHFACYDAFEYWGATLHHLTENVDQGEILRINNIRVSKTISPLHRMKIGERNAISLLKNLIQSLRINGYEKIISQKKYLWGDHVYKRKDFIEMCNLTGCSDTEVKKRTFAFGHKDYKNLYYIKNNKKLYI